MSLIKCHQILLGHSKKGGYGESIVSKKTPNINSPRSFDFQYVESRRNISSGDNNSRDNYVLEIEPVDNDFKYQAAICTQWSHAGTPSIYTHILIPDSGKMSEAASLLDKSCFMSGEKADQILESGILSTEEIETIEVDAGERNTCADIDYSQKEYYGNFLAIYWLTMVNTYPSKGRAGRQIPVIARNDDGTIMNPTEMVHFFKQDILAHFPLEAQGMASAVFNIKWGEAGNFKKAVCVFLTSDAGVKNAVDLKNGTNDILKSVPMQERDAIQVIGSYLMNGEKNFPNLYLQLREQLPGGIPKRAAPYVLYQCHMLENIPEKFNLKTKIEFIEYYYAQLFQTLVHGGENENACRDSLTPIINQLSELWNQREKADVTVWLEKKSWLKNTGHYSSMDQLRIIYPIQERIVDDFQNRSFSLDILQNVLGMLIEYDLAGIDDGPETIRLENYLVEHFLFWLSSDFHPYNDDETSKTIRDHRFVRIFRKWVDEYSISVSGEQSGAIKARLSEVAEKYPERDQTAMHESLALLDRIWLIYQNDTLKKTHTPTSTELRKLAEAVSNLKSNSKGIEEAVDGILAYISSNYMTWILDGDTFVKDDLRFLRMLTDWLQGEEWGIDEDLERIVTIENNAVITFNQYSVPEKEQNRALSLFRRFKNVARANRISKNAEFTNSEKAQEIAFLYHELNSNDALVSPEDSYLDSLDQTMIQYFVNWKDAKYPFEIPVLGRPVGYPDWLLILTPKWTDQIVSRYTGEDFQNLKDAITILTNVFKKYGIKESVSNETLRKARIICGILECNMITESNSPQMEKAKQLVLLHRNIRNTDKNLVEDTKFEQVMTQRMQDFFVEWGKLSKPFASYFDNNMEVFDDDWLINVAKRWLKDEFQYFGSTDLAEMKSLYGNLSHALSRYGVQKEQIESLLADLKIRIGQDSFHNISKDTQNRKEIALRIATIHHDLKDLINMRDDQSDFNDELSERMLEYFLDWAAAEPPFSYLNEDVLNNKNDEWIIDIATEWVRNRLADSQITSSELEELWKKVRLTFKKYNADAQYVLDRIFNEYGSRLVKELDENGKLSENEISKLVCLGCSDTLNDSCKEDIKEFVADHFVEWSKTSPSFIANSDTRNAMIPYVSTGSEQYLIFLHDVLKKWVNGSIIQTSDVEELKQIEEQLSRRRQISGSQEYKRLIQYRMGCQIEEVESKQTLDDEDVFTLTGIRAYNIRNSIQSEYDNRILDLLVQNFILWSDITPSFAVRMKSPNFENINFLQILQKWENEYLLFSNYGINELRSLLNKVEDAARSYHIEPELIHDSLTLIESEINRKRFIIAEEKDLLSFDDIAEVAEIRKWFIDNVPGSEELTGRMTRFLKEHFLIWNETDKPFSAGKYGYQDQTILSIIGQWLDSNLTIESYDQEVLKKLRLNLEYALRKYHPTFSPAQIQNEMKTLLLAEYRNTLETIDDPTPKDLTEMADMYQVLCIQYPDAGNRNADDLKDQLKNLLTKYFTAWAEADKPFLCTKGDTWARNRIFLTVAKDWLNQEIRDVSLAFEDVNRICELIKNEISLNEDGAQLFSLIDLLLATSKVKQINEKEEAQVTSKDTVELAEFYLSLNGTSRYTSRLKMNIQHLLEMHFVKWSYSGFTHTTQNKPVINNSLPFDTIIERWSTTYLWDSTIKNDEITTLQEEVEEAGRRYYQIDENKMEVFQREICRYQLNKNLDGSTDGYSKDKLFETIELFTKLEAYNSVSADIERKTIDYLETNFLDWQNDSRINTFGRGTYCSVHLIVKVAQKWCNRLLMKQESFSLEKIREIQNNVIHIINNSDTDQDSLTKSTLDCFEKIWIHCAIIDYSEGTDEITIPEIAGEIEAFESKGMTIEDDELKDVSLFLVDHFSEWAQDGFQTESKGRIYSFKRFISVAEQWIEEKRYLGLSAIDMDKMIELLKLVCIRNYGMPERKCTDLLSPMKQEYAYSLFSETRSVPTTDRIKRTIQLYVDAPELYGDRIYDLFSTLDRYGMENDQLAVITESLVEVWKTNTGQHKQIVFFLNDLYSSERPDYQKYILQEAMLHILENEHFVLDENMEKKKNWVTLREQLIEQDLIQVLKKIDTASDRWNDSYADKYSLDWNKITRSPFFERNLTDAVNEQWKEEWDNNDEDLFIKGITYTAEKNIESDYGKLLVKAIKELITREFESKFLNAEFHDRLVCVRKSLSKYSETYADLEKMCILMDYQRDYDSISDNWDVNKTVQILSGRIPKGKIYKKGTETWNIDKHTERWLFTTLLEAVPESESVYYWDMILEQLDVPDPVELDKKNLRTIAETNLMDELQFAFMTIVKYKQLVWLLNDLKQYLKNRMPEMWSEIHGGLFGNGIRKLNKNGWNAEPAEFYVWLKDENSK